jgi:hypothetical protein
MKLYEIASNSYFTFTDYVPVWVKSGSEASNHYYGASRLYRPTYNKATASPGDELHWLHGGLFFVSAKNQAAVYVQLTAPKEFSPFEKRHNYTDPREREIQSLISAGSLERIGPDERIHANYNAR